MPEGDTLFRTATVLAQVLTGQRLVAAELDDRYTRVLAADLVGRSVTRVEARGKNLLFALDDDHLLWSHLRMTGSWHFYRPGEPWQRPVRQRTVALHTARAVAVGFNVPVLERLHTGRLDAHPVLGRLSPDLLGPSFDLADALSRFRADPRCTLADALLNQRIAAGIGNVYKSEVLYICRANPWMCVDDAGDELLTRLLLTARRLLQRNVDGHLRRTAHTGGGDRYHVYERQGLPCLTCRTPIAMQRHGDGARSTYFCPSCQSVALQTSASPGSSVRP